MNIKEELLKKCHQFVNNRLQNIEETISSNQTALQSETKSSAGDKHETGRAMLQLEMEKAGQQIANIQQMKETLAKIDVLKKSTNAHLGSLIKTNTGNYFLSVSVGQLKVDNELYFAVSVSSPIGKLLLGKSVNEQVMFNSKNIKLLSIK
jgi:transcription elongation GreA/GreB family factor